MTWELMRHWTGRDKKPPNVDTAHVLHPNDHGEPEIQVNDYAADGSCVLVAVFWERKSARLGAAAPELLAELERCRERIHSDVCSGRACVAECALAVHALKKAKGET